MMQNIFCQISIVSNLKNKIVIVKIKHSKKGILSTCYFNPNQVFQLDIISVDKYFASLLFQQTVKFKLMSNQFAACLNFTVLVGKYSYILTLLIYYVRNLLSIIAVKDRVCLKLFAILYLTVSNVQNLNALVLMSIHSAKLGSHRIGFGRLS